MCPQQKAIVGGVEWIFFQIQIVLVIYILFLIYICFSQSESSREYNIDDQKQKLITKKNNNKTMLVGQTKALPKAVVLENPFFTQRLALQVTK